MFKRILLVLALGLAALPVLAEGFSFQDMRGKTHTLAGYKGKWVLVNFWATWCPPCLEEIPDLVALHDKHKDKDLVVLGVAMDYRDPKEVAAFAENYLISYPVILGNPKLAAQVGQLPGYPTSFLYDPQGKLVAYNPGILTRKAVEDYIRPKKK
ncbi:MAG: TlpA disulfide reductase family protein [Pseudomonadota bacterium]|jgi:thiol-disulfide isomerase/thioredoxin